jgi:hypothetical protein
VPNPCVILIQFIEFPIDPKHVSNAVKGEGPVVYTPFLEKQNLLGNQDVIPSGVNGETYGIIMVLLYLPELHLKRCKTRPRILRDIQRAGIISFLARTFFVFL